MNAEAVNRRLDLVGTSAGSVVSVATWCALHAQDAEIVISCLCAKLAAPTTTDQIRASLLFVLHELLLTCASSGTSESAKRAVLLVVARLLPGALDKVWQSDMAATSGETGALNAAVGKVVVWWALLNLFPQQWLDDIRRKHRKAQEESGLDTSAAVTLQRALHLLGRYQDAKEQWVRGRERHRRTGEPLDAAAEEAARRALAVLRKAVDGRLEGSRSLGRWCAAQQAELDGQQSAAVGNAAKREKTEPPLSAVKTEETATNASPAAEDDDILGSFY